MGSENKRYSKKAAIFSAAAMVGFSHTRESTSTDNMSSMMVANRLMKKRLFHRAVLGIMAATPSPSAVRVNSAPIRPKASSVSQSVISLRPLTKMDSGDF